MKTIRVRAPKNMMIDLRFKFPGVSDSALLEMTYGTSLLKAEVKLEKMDFKNKFGRIIYGKNAKLFEKR